ncbi:MAG TPA: hypothetical protein VK196_20845 [Magnetospirillum sp.]|nr:hypothetical protein [Magnetospirillum sp.]
MSRTHRGLLLGATLTLAACAQVPESPQSALALPAALAGKAVVLQPDDPDYGRAVVAQAVQPAGAGGISGAVVVKLTHDVPAYRLWSGPAAVNAQGQTNRIGQWWSYDAPAGTREGYRVSYEICNSWNTLTWVATCTLKVGAVVAIGPGQSVSAVTCGSDGESYPANPVQWQTFVSKAWSRPSELSCPDAAKDYENDPGDIARPAKVGPAS